MWSWTHDIGRGTDAERPHPKSRHDVSPLETERTEVITLFDELIMHADGTLSHSTVAVNAAYVVRARESTVETATDHGMKVAHIVTELTLSDGTTIRVCGMLPATVAKLNGAATEPYWRSHELSLTGA